MGLRLASVELRDFRNHASLRIDRMKGLTVLVGENGAGKTNVLESLHLTLAGESFRRARLSQIVRHGLSQAYAKATLVGDGRSLDVELFVEPGKRKFQVNGKPRSLVSVKGILPVVTFVPDDLEMAKKASAVKRDALDSLGTQVSKSYHVVHQDYDKALRYKNRLLKDEAAPGLIDAMNDTFLTCATQLYCYRHALFSRLVPLVKERYAKISHSDEAFGASYVSSWDYLANGEVDPAIAGLGEGLVPDKAVVRQKLESALAAYSAEERRRFRCLVGPHNDKISFYLDGNDASVFASQGQQRSIVLAWKLAEVDFVKETVGQAPLLLLDDVMSELDASRRELLMHSLGDDVQAILTATDLEAFAGGVTVVRIPSPFVG